MSASECPKSSARDRERAMSRATVSREGVGSRLAVSAASWLAAGERAILVEVEQTAGSAPREAGARMLVSCTACEGTVGGGHLEWKAIKQARRMLADRHLHSVTLRYPLGPALGQCCGGVVTLAFTHLTAAHLQTWPDPRPRFSLQLYGAGHVGRAIAQLLTGIDCDVDWIDERDEQFAGAPAAPHIRRVAVDAVEAEVDAARPGAYYLVLTHRHDLDLRICERILARSDVGFLGLIGSQTKRAKFVHHFERRGVPAATLARLTCPIGAPGIVGKEPEVIAIAVVAQLLQHSSSVR